jgi:hypothetical protein
MMSLDYAKIILNSSCNIGLGCQTALLLEDLFDCSTMEEAKVDLVFGPTGSQRFKDAKSNPFGKHELIKKITGMRVLCRVPMLIFKHVHLDFGHQSLTTHHPRKDQC